MSAILKQSNHQIRLMQILRKPHISEKSTITAEKHRQFVFKVSRDATKPEIKQAVELLFEVRVNAVRVCNMKGKIRRFKQFTGQKNAWKKAYVSLQEGYDIDFIGVK